MADRYKSFIELADSERLGIDYRIRALDRGSEAVILAPHGGWIEPSTSEIAEAIAGTDLSFYAFEALRNGPHGHYHITSHRFDEPSAIELVGKSSTSIAIHGRRRDGTDAVWLGGRDTCLREAVRISLQEAGFGAEINQRLPGLDEANICNRTRSGMGVQLELSPRLRTRLTTDARLLQSFCEAVRNSVQQSRAT
ncbi:poly-gamma-glutamate hydrolase family protein [Paracoccus sp. WLY502]|uniref:poly-gamma-glutamate hydrolase family protein n=1 Tax=Paracoccus yibinensis TaxID=3068891 RepID=UPI00279675BE|nr:poly-gamma-glutamate hydrolase family protein [Paracoccus sp. WLY502]MDQ1902368.1 poly-gamma-glutamate hydrolase family protein [Paracoccus sp. WLY502]